jgi:CubicO group peptidase (beta-lactamase class C family)
MVNNTEIQQLFDDAVNRGLAPGFQYAVFSQKQVLAAGTSGLAKMASETDPYGVPMQPETILWIASAGKILVSLVTLIVLERGLAHNGMTLDDLDNHEKLVQILPEFRQGSGSLVTKIVTGFKQELGPDGKKVPILHDSNGKITLRDLMTHTSGFPYFVSSLPIPCHHSDVDPTAPSGMMN